MFVSVVIFAAFAAVGFGQTTITVPAQGDGIFIDSSPASFLGQGFQGLRTGLDGFSQGFMNPTTSPSIIFVDVAEYSSDLSQTYAESLFEFGLTTGGSVDTVSNGKTYQLGSDGYVIFQEDGRGATDFSVSGWVKILDVEGGSVFPDNSVFPVIALDFYLTEDNDPNRWIFGSIRIDSDIPYTTSAIPEPSTYSAIAGIIGLGVVLIHAKRRRASLAP